MNNYVAYMNFYAPIHTLSYALCHTVFHALFHTMLYALTHIGTLSYASIHRFANAFLKKMLSLTKKYCVHYYTNHFYYQK